PLERHSSYGRAGAVPMFCQPPWRIAGASNAGPNQPVVSLGSCNLWHDHPRLEVHVSHLIGSAVLVNSSTRLAGAITSGVLVWRRPITKHPLMQWKVHSRRAAFSGRDLA